MFWSWWVVFLLLMIFAIMLRCRQWYMPYIFFWGLRPDPQLKYQSGRNEYRVLAPAAAVRARKWERKETRYLKRSWSLLRLHQQKSSIHERDRRVGGTEDGNNWIGYIHRSQPRFPMIVYSQLVEMVKVCQKEDLRHWLKVHHV